ncbi:MAG: patatin-like phospholipase family protein [Candidatus Eremiobacteraeota bacterium]|nr:patatin-like phospholipase family protein [Candidatus Eremiobacteraeota bacterium]
MKALILSGGGARGAYEAGVATALAERERFDLICGSSIGAVNGAFIAQGDLGGLRQLWREVIPQEIPAALPHVSQLREVVERLGSLGSGNRMRDLRALLHAVAGMRTLDKYRDSARVRAAQLAGRIAELVDVTAIRHNLLVTATNLSAGVPAAFLAGADGRPLALPRGEHRRTEYHAITRENVGEVLVASSALPGLFPEIEIVTPDGPQHFADGGLLNNSPIGLAIDAGATDITVVFVDEFDRSALSLKRASVGERFFVLFLMLQQRLLEDELRMVHLTNEVIRLGGKTDAEYIAVHQVRPAAPLPVNTLDFDNVPAMDAAFEQGIWDGQRVRSTLIHAAVGRIRHDSRNFFDLRRLFRFGKSA